MVIRFAEEHELEKINRLRRQVNDLHVAGKPDVFKPGFGRELADYVYTIHRDPEQAIVVAELDGVLCGLPCSIISGNLKIPSCMSATFWILMNSVWTKPGAARASPQQ